MMYLLSVVTVVCLAGISGIQGASTGQVLPSDLKHYQSRIDKSLENLAYLPNSYTNLWDTVKHLHVDIPLLTAKTAFQDYITEKSPMKLLEGASKQNGKEEVCAAAKQKLEDGTNKLIEKSSSCAINYTSFEDTINYQKEFVQTNFLTIVVKKYKEIIPTCTKESQKSHEKLKSCVSKKLDIARSNYLSLEKRYQYSISLIVKKGSELIKSARQCYDKLEKKVYALHYHVVKDCVNPQL